VSYNLALKQEINTTKTSETQQPITIIVSYKTSKTWYSRIGKKTTVNITLVILSKGIIYLTCRMGI